MQEAEVFRPKLMPFPAVILLWTAVAVLLGCVFALAGVASILLAAMLAVLLVFGAIAGRYPAAMLGACIWCLGLVPFTWGLQTGVLPKIFADEALLLAYITTFPLLYLFGRRIWQPGFGVLYALLAALVVLQSLSLFVSTDLIAFRNFVETFVLGPVLLVLFLQEASNVNPETVGSFVVGLTVVISFLSILERIFQWNPIMQSSLLYMSPDIVRATAGIYRPYVSFFHPSESGTFLALGMPFVVRWWLQSKSWISILSVLIVFLGVASNATRGVWAGVLGAGLIELRYAWIWLIAAVPIGAIGVWITYLAFQGTSFVARIADPRDFIARLEYWRVAWRVFITHPWLGIGHMQFARVYLDYVQATSMTVDFNFSETGVADNIFMTTAVENGLIGLAVLIVFLLYVGLKLRYYRKTLYRSGLKAQGSFVQCAEVALNIYVITGCLADIHLFTKATKFFFILVGLGLAEGARYVPASRHEKTDRHSVAAFQLHEAR